MSRWRVLNGVFFLPDKPPGPPPTTTTLYFWSAAAGVASVAKERRAMEVKRERAASMVGAYECKGRKEKRLKYDWV